MIGPGAPPWNSEVFTIDLFDPMDSTATVIGSGFDAVSYIGAAFGPDGALYLSDRNCNRVLRIAPSDPLGTSYCFGVENSAGCGASISAIGSTVLTDNDFTLRVAGCPATVNGIFYYGGVQVQIPFGEGFRCVGGTTQRLQPPLVTSSGGIAERAVDLSAPPIAATALPGSNLNLQFWYRDRSGGPSGFNFSNGLNVVWQ